MKRLFPLFSLACFLFACSPTNSSLDCDRLYEVRDSIVVYHGEKTNDLVVHLSSEPPNFHPTIQSTANRNAVLAYTHQALAAVNDEGGIEADLAEGPPEVSEDGLTYTYRVHPDAKWEDGRPITAKDVLFSYKVATYEYTESPAASVFLQFLADILLDEADERKLSLVMTEQYILNPHLTSNQSILDQAFFDPDHLMDTYSFTDLKEEDAAATRDQTLIEWASEFKSAKYGREVAFLQGGAGPYKIKAWEPGVQITIERKENYWGKNISKQYPDRITFKFIGDDQSLALQIKQQAIDVSTQLSTAAFKELEKSEEGTCHYQLLEVNRLSVAVLILNNRPDGIAHARIFDDKKVRKAFALSIPLDEILQTYMPTAKRLKSSVSIHHPDNNANLPFIPYDQDRAKVLLDEAGWKDSDQDGIRDQVIDGKRIPLEFSLSYANTQQAITDIVERIRLELAQVGIKCNPEPLKGISGKLVSKEYDAILTALTMSSAPYDFHQLWYSANWPNGSNFTGYSNPRMDELSSQARVEQDATKRRVLTDEIQQILYDDQPMICLFNPTKKIAIHRRFSHLEVFSSAPYVELSNLEVIRE